MTAKTAPPTALPPSPQELAAARERAEHRTGWAFLWVLFGFKMATVVAIAVAARSEEAAVILAATTWYWLPLPVVAVGGTLLFRWRLHRVRRRREQLRRAEWLLDDGG
jgi:hypothetical protein